MKNNFNIYIFININNKQYEWFIMDSILLLYKLFITNIHYSFNLIYDKF